MHALLPIDTAQLLNYPNADFFNCHDWFLHFNDSIATPLQAAIQWFTHSPEKPDVVLPLMISSTTPRQLQGASNYYSPLFDYPSGNAADWPLFMQQLCQQLPPWDVLQLQPLSLEKCQALQQACQQARLPTAAQVCFGNWYLPLEDTDFSRYLAQRPSQLKNTLARKGKRFHQQHGARLQVLCNAEAFAHGLAAYQQVYQASWKVPEPFPAFMPGLMQLAAQHGALRLGVAWLGDKPIAAQCWIVANGTASIFKLAYDEAYQALSAGSLLTAHLLQYVMEVDGVTAVDYLSGDDAYKQQWMSHRRERWGLTLFNPNSLRGRWGYSRHCAKHWLKRQLRA
jgi:hypothetical protein